jgi:hypothetical protein
MMIVAFIPCPSQDVSELHDIIMDLPIGLVFFQPLKEVEQSLFV